MIRYNPKLWFRHIFDFPKSDSFRILFPEMIVVGLYTAAVVVIENAFFANISIFKVTTAVHSLIGFVLGLLLVFRTNTAYERWWEGRKLWGALVNNTRNLALRLNALLGAKDDKERMFFASMIPNYVFAAKEHLREGVIVGELKDVDGLQAEIKKRDHKPNYIAQKIYEKVISLNREKCITNEELLLLDKEIKSFTDLIGACERIRNTPIPYSYNLFIKKFIFIYTATLPVGFVPSFGYWTVPFVIFIFYVLVSLEILAEEIEDPFGEDANDLPLDELCHKIDGNVKEILGLKK